MNIKYQNLIKKLKPFVVSYSKNLLDLDFERLNFEIPDELKIDPLKMESRNFIELLYRMDELTFGGQGMGMPRWVMFDCAVMPGFVFGFAMSKEDLSQKDHELFGDIQCDYVPLSMYIALPMLENNTWFGHNLSSLNNILEQSLSGLGLLTKHSALKLFDVRTLYGATQWNSPALNIHLQLGDLILESAYTPIHSKEMTLCYKSHPLDDETALGESRVTNCSDSDLFEVTVQNVLELQKKIENNSVCTIINKPKISGDRLYFEIVKN
jgi:hypothetical protein